MWCLLVISEHFSVRIGFRTYMSWSFAIINNKLAEVFFDKTRKGLKFRSHCYVNRSEYTDKRELKQLDKDTQKVKLTYRNQRYNLISG